MNESKGKIKETWSVINNLLGRGKKKTTLCDFVLKSNVKITDKKEIANTFNEFYINVGPNLAKSIDESNVKIKFDDYVKNIGKDKTMFVMPTTDAEILNIVSNFSCKNSEDVNGMSMKVLKYVICSIIKPIVYISNLSLSTGVFPENLKIAKVIPLFKSGEVQDVSNYRPVSILSQISKIIEKLFEIRLRNYIDKNNFLFNGQYGFRTSQFYKFSFK